MRKILLFVPALFLLACNDEAKETPKNEKQSIEPTFKILPPVEEFTPEAEVFSIDNSKDTILISDHGSFINVPANCFEDEDGQSVEDVEVQFTEYTNPADIILSGIPMEFVTEEGNETFQSAGMCEIDAASNGKKVSMAKGKAIDIGLKNQAQDSDYNLYYFDKEKGEWLEKEKALAVDTTTIPAKPVTLTTIDTSRILHVDVEDYSLNRDFKMWDQSNFYLLPGQDPKYHAVGASWYHMEVVKTTNPELFILKFFGTLRGEQVVEALKVQPLIAPERYDESMQTFNRKMRMHATRLLERKGKKEQLLNADETIAQIEEEHEEMKEQMKREEEQMRIEAEKMRIADSIRTAEFYAASEVRTDVMRTFEVNQLGLYNCDRFYTREILATKSISFKYGGEVLEFNNTFLCSPRDNAVLTYVKGSGGTYSIDLSQGKFYFVGLKGKEIFCKEVTLETSNGSHEIDQIEKEMFENLMI